MEFLKSFKCEGVCPHESCALSVLRGWRNGVVYGARIRAPHALVMTFLFRNGTFLDKVRAVVKATYTHSKNLGMYVALYKLVLCFMRHVRGQNSMWNYAVAGAVGGVAVFGEENPVNSQINMYVLSRIAVGLARSASKHNVIPVPKYAYKMFAAFCWICVMALFETDTECLQGSLVASMEYLYHDSDSWPVNPASVFHWFALPSPNAK